MSKTIEEIGLVVGGLALALLAGPIGVGLYGSLGLFHLMVGVGLAAALGGSIGLLTPGSPVGIALGQQSITQAVTYWRIIYGHFTCAGVPTFLANAGGSAATGQTLHVVYTVAAHQISAFQDLANGNQGGYAVLVDGIPMKLTPEGDGYWVPFPNSPYAGYLAFEFDTGNPANTGQPFPNLAAANVGWNSTTLQRGRAKVHVAMKYSQNEINTPPSYGFSYFVGGRIPEFQFRIIGKPITDPRLSGAGAWQPHTHYQYPAVVIDTHGHKQLCQIAAPGFISGGSQPSWNDSGGQTNDGTQSNAWLDDGALVSAISNPALVIYDFLLWKSIGMGVDPATIDLDTVAAAANYCEELIPISKLGDPLVIEPRYSCDGMFDASSARGVVLQALLTSMAGWAVPPGDMWRIFAGRYFDPALSFGDDDFRDSIKGDFRLSRRDICNSVKGTFWTTPPVPHSPAQPFQQTDFPPYQADGVNGRPNYITEDGGETIWKDIQLSFTQSIWNAQRLAKITLMALRYQETFVLPCKLKALPCQAGDTIQISHPRWGLDNAIVQVIQATLVSENKSETGTAMGVDLVVRQTAPQVWAFNPTEYSPYNSTGHS